MNVTLQDRINRGLCVRCGKEPAMRGKTRGRNCQSLEKAQYELKAARRRANRPTRIGKVTGRVKLSRIELAKLRWAVFERSGGQCEKVTDGKRCTNTFGWSNMHLHHLLKRSLGGSDSLENCAGWCETCHKREHNQ